ncbi:hypothetical protein EAG_14297 [Camponotus floridanus]|uniref:Uncharacterized protein n=1 Tax=Camponotus floridanus TaxID=104421 RepID=E2A9B2_CAMFO|nr:hypothetical protein EAG_14297 [Camponotus floridanus]
MAKTPEKDGKNRIGAVLIERYTQRRIEGGTWASVRSNKTLRCFLLRGTTQGRSIDFAGPMENLSSSSIPILPVSTTETENKHTKLNTDVGNYAEANRRSCVLQTAGKITFVRVSTEDTREVFVLGVNSDLSSMATDTLWNYLLSFIPATHRAFITTGSAFCCIRVL